MVVGCVCTQNTQSIALLYFPLSHFIFKFQLFFGNFIKEYNVSQLCPFPFPQYCWNAPTHHPLTFEFSFTFFFAHWVQLMLSICPWVWGHSLRRGEPTSGHTPKKSDPLPSYYQLLPSKASSKARSSSKACSQEPSPYLLFLTLLCSYSPTCSATALIRNG